MQGKVLVIEDDAAFRAYLCALLERAGIAATALDATRHFQRAFDTLAPKVVITDIYMPEMDGIEVLRTVKQQRPDVVVIALSGGSAMFGLDPLQSANRLGADHVFVKPLDAARFVGAVKAALDA